MNYYKNNNKIIYLFLNKSQNIIKEIAFYKIK